LIIDANPYIAATAACFTEVNLFSTAIFASQKEKKMLSKFKFAFVMTLLSTAVAIADTPGVKVISTSAGDVFTLYYQTPSSGSVKVSIFNRNNQTVFSEIINEQGSFTRPYNFSQLPKGEYKLVVVDKSGKHEQVIKYGVDIKKTYIKVAEINKQESRFVLNVGTVAEETVTVRIYDNAKGLVHEQEIAVDGNYGLIYNLSKVRSSEKSVVMFEVSTSAGQVETAMF
jgi:hypothetical protein